MSWRTRVVLVVLAAMAGCGGRSAQNTSDEPAPAEADPNVATEKDWSGQMATRPEELLEGRFPGVQVIRLPEGIAVRIRGSSSVMGDREPLYVVDGMTIEPGPDGALVGLNPSDIERIEVLKDIGSTSLYGVRGANGVILIKTRRAR